MLFSSFWVILLSTFMYYHSIALSTVVFQRWWVVQGQMFMRESGKHRTSKVKRNQRKFRYIWNCISLSIFQLFENTPPRFSLYSLKSRKSQPTFLLLSTSMGIRKPPTTRHEGCLRWPVDGDLTCFCFCWPYREAVSKTNTNFSVVGGDATLWPDSQSFRRNFNAWLHSILQNLL